SAPVLQLSRWPSLSFTPATLIAFRPPQCSQGASASNVASIFWQRAQVPRILGSCPATISVSHHWQTWRTGVTTISFDLGGRPRRFGATMVSSGMIPPEGREGRSPPLRFAQELDEIRNKTVGEVGVNF